MNILSSSSTITILQNLNQSIDWSIKVKNIRKFERLFLALSKTNTKNKEKKHQS